jgi:DNA-binding CsgD family transcriptional regulator
MRIDLSLDPSRNEPQHARITDTMTNCHFFSFSRGTATFAPRLTYNAIRPARYEAAGLTAREIEATRLICDGLTTKEIAVRMGISTKTADTHRTRLMLKAGVHSSASLVRWACRTGLVTP